MQWLLDIARETVVTIGVPAGLILAWSALKLADQHGYKTTYAAALLRAVGQGQIAAQTSGVSLFSPAGRAIAVRVGTEYLMNTVPDASAALDIKTDADHGARIIGQIGSMQAAAAAAALEPLSRIPADTIVPVHAIGDAAQQVLASVPTTPARGP